MLEPPRGPRSTQSSQHIPGTALGLTTRTDPVIPAGNTEFPAAEEPPRSTPGSCTYTFRWELPEGHGAP